MNEHKWGIKLDRRCGGAEPSISKPGEREDSVKLERMCVGFELSASKPGESERLVGVYERGECVADWVGWC